MKKLFIFDLDGTVIDSDHRTPRLPDGSVDVHAFLALKTRKTVFRDTLLPLARTMRLANRDPDTTVAVCTSRTMHDMDLHYLKFHRLDHDIMLHRIKGDFDTPDAALKTGLIKPLLDKFRSVVMFDDNLSVIEAIRALGVRVINSTHHNKRLAAMKG
jgi:hypothetical protein